MPAQVRSTGRLPVSRIIRGFVATLAVVALLIGLPLALAVFVGRPWPHTLPAFDVMWRNIRRGEFTDSAVVHVLALVLWLAWARLAVSLLIELLAKLTGRSAPRVAALGSFQQFAAALVTAIVLFVGWLPRAAIVSASPVRSRPLPVLLLGPDAMASHRAEDRVVPPPGLRSIQVIEGDTLSGIAAHELGDPRAWPDVWNVNRGRDFEGRTFDDPNLILPGWQLVIPDASAPVAALVAVSVADAVVVPALASTLEPSAEPGAAPTRETSVESGAAPTTEPVIACVVPVDQTAAAADSAPDAGAQSIDRGSPHRLAATTGLGGAVLLASGVVACLATLRRRQLRSAPRNARLVEPTRDHAALETVLRRLDHGELISRIDIALRAIASELIEAAPGVAVSVVLAFTDGRLEIVLTAAVSPVPLPWLGVAPDRWQLPAGVPVEVLADRARRVNQPCPAMAHLGSTREPSGTDAAQVFVDLEALGLLAIDAERPHATDIARAIAAGVAMSPLSEIAFLVTCGLGNPHLGRPLSFGTETLDSALDLAVGLLGSTVSASSAALSTFALRSRRQGGEVWEPAIVVAALHDDGDDAMATIDNELVNLGAMAGRGLGVVVDRGVKGARWRIEAHLNEWVLQPLGIVIIPVGLTASDVAQVHSLLWQADVPLLDVGPVDVPSAPVAVVGPSTWSEPSWSIMVRLLGPVEVCDPTGQRAVFERSKALELVVWLSQHRDRSTRTSARTALWELNVRDATFANVVSDSRRALRRLASVGDSDEWIQRTLTEQLPLHHGVVTDADLLRARMEHARTQTPTDAVTTLRPGLALVRDQVFFGTSYLWTDAEGMTTQLTLLVTSAASVLAGHYLTLGDIEGVFWATGQGLKVLAGHEELIALRMRAHALHGDLAGVRQEWESYERALMADSWSSAEPAPKLVTLRRELLSQSLLQV